MKNDTSEKRINRHTALSGLLLIIVAAATLAATSFIQYYFAEKGLRDEATTRAKSQLKATRNQIMDIVNQTESAVRNSVWIASWCLDYPDSLDRVAKRLVRDNPVVIGSTVAVVPDYYKRRPLFAPYAFRADSGEFILKSLATEEYDYPSQEWFTEPIKRGEGYWSEPYVDVGGGDVLMTTYSMPVMDKDGKIAAVVTADISLDWLTDLVGKVELYPHAFSVVVSRKGQIMVSPVREFVMTKTVTEAISTMEDTVTLKAIGLAMMKGEEGEATVVEKGVSNRVFFAPIERTGWSMTVVIPENEVYAKLRKMKVWVRLMQLLGMALLLLILLLAARNQRKLAKINQQKDKMEGELKIARGIQMAMIPKIFPPFPERKDIDMSATIVPAKEVGGDLYDFYIRDEKLFFCVGDVSGKGVPASLVMAVTRSLFRTVSAHEKSPQKIVTTMNESMSETNENNMFVTFFCGVLDMKTGHLRYCNAGHNAPMLLTDKIAPLPVEANLPLGIMEDMQFKEQELDLKYDDAIFLYTDGLTEAENAVHELFGEQRMVESLRGRKDSEGHLENMKEAVNNFVAGAPQSDDLTMLFIHYLNDNIVPEVERHLVLHNDVQQISQLAQFVDSIAAEKKLDTTTASNINLALEEAVTNVIMYAYPEGKHGLVDIGAILRDDELEFVITDSGKPFDPTAVPEADVTLGVEDRKVGGLGIFLVRKIMDNVRYERGDGKNILLMNLNI